MINFLVNRFLGAIKQYLCLSLLKNSASTLMIIFQLSCSIFISLVSRFRAGLKAEIGVFFPMIVLRVLENVAQPNFQQKMIVLRFLEKLCVDSQILVDIFINYDCDVNSSNIFERYGIYVPACTDHMLLEDSRIDSLMIFLLVSELMNTSIYHNTENDCHLFPYVVILTGWSMDFSKLLKVSLLVLPLLYCHLRMSP